MHIPTFHRRRAGLAALIGFALVATPVAVVPAVANPAGTGLVISEAYVNGGSAGATYSNKYVELFNPTNSAIDVSGYSLQYRAPTNTTGNPQAYPLQGLVAAGGYYLIQGFSNNATIGAALPTPDATTGFNPGGGGGQIFLANQVGSLSDPEANSAGVVDMLGYGTSLVHEGTTAAAIASVTTSISRAPNETDTDANSVDFATVAPSPRAVNPTPTPVVIPVPGAPVAISAIQGTTATSPYAGQSATTRGVITASYPSGGFNGYYIQTPGTGGEIDLAGHAASDGLFVYSPASVDEVEVGDYVEVTGIVSEFDGTTELTITEQYKFVEVLTETVTAPIPVSSDVPLTPAGRESLEGMLILPDDPYTVTDNYDTNFYGSLVLNPGTAPAIGPTVAREPGPEAIAYAAANVARAITLDDGSSISYNTQANKGTPLPYLSTTAPVRVGSAVTFTKPVVLEYRFSAWNFQPTQQLTATNAATVQPATFENTRTAAPDELGGDLTVASFNVLNYFSTTGDELAGCQYNNDRDGNPITVSGGCSARGAANEVNLERQQAKIVAAINKLDAEVVSLEEIENSLVTDGSPRDEALANLVDALNGAAGAGTWAFAPSPAAVPTGEDVIRSAFIYKPAKVAAVGDSVILDDPAFENAREPLAQEFAVAGQTAASAFLVIANHFKSKSSGTGAGDADTGDGQGASNGSRVRQARALVAFADGLKAARNVQRVLLQGDFNAYLKEDPIDVLVAAGYVDLGSTRTDKETYAFDGTIGSLDHIFANAAALASVTDVDIWNINAYEAVALEYSRYNYNALNLYVDDPYRSSDHDPILVGLKLTVDAATPPVTSTPTPTPTPTPTSTAPTIPSIDSNLPKIDGANKVGSTLRARTGTWDPRPVTLYYRWLNDGRPIIGATAKSYKLKASDKGDRIAVQVTGVKTGYPTVVRTSASVKVYRAFTATPKPRISGTPSAGKTLSVTAGKWKPAKVSLRYQWYRDGEAIRGADKKKYKLVKADRGNKITVKVTGRKAGYLTESETRSVARIR